MTTLIKSLYSSSILFLFPFLLIAHESSTHLEVNLDPIEHVGCIEKKFSALGAKIKLEYCGNSGYATVSVQGMEVGWGELKDNGKGSLRVEITYLSPTTIYEKEGFKIYVNKANKAISYKHGKKFIFKNWEWSKRKSIGGSKNKNRKKKKKKKKENERIGNCAKC